MNNHDYAGAIMRNKRDIEDLANTQVSLTSDIELAAKKLPLE